MAVALYDLSVASYLQTLAGVAGVLDRGAAHCRDNNIDPEEIVETRLYGDMLPFRFQIISVAHHSLGAIEGVKKGAFAPPTERRPLNYAQLQELVADTRAALGKLDAAEVNALEGGDVTFAIGDFKMPFTAENFLMSFSLPNFYFHAATAYDILRSKGVPLGKRDFMGAVRMKAA
ncbi:MAG TPA: DUF1993 domain-containing protein [Caulobacteraceae bacterium]|jgi:hypothetical protein|nr:DUF1993 domain-containing protein [Caulobacteraceae bacterium]